jgi:hypothetical protein
MSFASRGADTLLYPEARSPVAANLVDLEADGSGCRGRPDPRSPPPRARPGRAAPRRHAGRGHEQPRVIASQGFLVTATTTANDRPLLALPSRTGHCSHVRPDQGPCVCPNTAVAAMAPGGGDDDVSGWSGPVPSTAPAPATSPSSTSPSSRDPRISQQDP